MAIPNVKRFRPFCPTCNDSFTLMAVLPKEVNVDSYLAEAVTRHDHKAFQEAKKVADTWMGRFDSAVAYIQLGAFTEADSELEVCLKRRGEVSAIFLDDVPSFRELPAVYYYLGRAQQGLKSPAAAESFKTFLAMHSKADHSPLAADVQRRMLPRADFAEPDIIARFGAHHDKLVADLG